MRRLMEWLARGEARWQPIPREPQRLPSSLDGTVWSARCSAPMKVACARDWTRDSTAQFEKGNWQPSQEGWGGIGDELLE